MNSARLAAGQLRRRGGPPAPEVRAARRLAVVLILIAGGVSHGGPAGAAFVRGFFIQVSPVETTPGQFNAMDIDAVGTDLGERLSITLQGHEIASGETGTGNPQNGDALVLNGVSIPPGVATCGTDTVNLVWIGQVQASTTVQVFCPTVTVTPDPVISGGGPASFTVTGAGYPASRDVSLTLDGATNTALKDIVTNGNGGFTESVSLSALACGTHSLTGIAGSGQPVIQSVQASAVDPYPTLPASTTFTATGCVTPGQQKLTANPAIVVDGMYTHVTGTGFVPNQPVTLTWQTPAGATLTTCSPTADSAPPLSTDGNGAVDTFCFAPPHVIIGAAQIVATQNATQDGVAVTDKAAAPVVVEGGSMQPSSGGDELIFRR